MKEGAKKSVLAYIGAVAIVLVVLLGGAWVLGKYNAHLREQGYETARQEFSAEIAGLKQALLEANHEVSVAVVDLKAAIKNRELAEQAKKAAEDTSANAQIEHQALLMLVSAVRELHEDPVKGLEYSTYKKACQLRSNWYGVWKISISTSGIKIGEDRFDYERSAGGAIVDIKPNLKGSSTDLNDLPQKKFAAH